MRFFFQFENIFEPGIYNLNVRERKREKEQSVGIEFQKIRRKRV